MDTLKPQTTDSASIQARQLLHSGVKPLAAIAQLKAQGYPETDAKLAVKNVLLEMGKQGSEKEKSISSLLIIGIPIVLIVSYFLSMYMTILIGGPIGLIGGTIILIRMAKKRRSS